MKASQIILPAVAETGPTRDEILAIVSAAELKAETRITHALEVTKIEDAIVEAFDYLDGKGWLNRAILTQVWKGYANRFDKEIELPFPPLQSVDQIRYVDTDGEWQTLATSVYGVSTVGLFGKIYLKSYQNWPDIYTDPESIEITFTAGYGAGEAIKSDVPGIRKAIKLLAVHYNTNPSATYPEQRLVEVPRKVLFGLQDACGKYRIANDHS